MNIQYTPAPWSTETCLFAEFPKAEMLASKEVIAEFHLHTKTRLSISLRHGNKTINVNFIPSGSEGLKFDAEKGTNWFSGNSSTRQYFKISKKQGLPQVEQHLKNIMKHLGVEDAEFTINIWVNKAAMAMGAKVPELVEA